MLQGNQSRSGPAEKLQETGLRWLQVNHAEKLQETGLRWLQVNQAEKQKQAW